MLRLAAAQAETLWDEALPIEVRVAARRSRGARRTAVRPGAAGAVRACWEREALVSGVSAAGHGRPTLAIETYVRLMVLKHRHGWGYRSLVAEVSDSIHLRRFCRIALTERVPDESTVRKLTQTDRRADRQRHHARADRGSGPRAALSGAGGQDRLDGDRGRHQVPDRRGPGIARRPLAGAGGPQAGRPAEGQHDAGARPHAFDGPRAARDLPHDPPSQRGGEGRGARPDRADRGAARSGPSRRRAGSPRQPGARRAAAARRPSCGRPTGSTSSPIAARRSPRQIKQRIAGEKITDRLISLSDPDARPIRKGKLGKPNEFGYVAQIAEVTPNTKRGARGLILPAASLPGNPGENQLLPQTVTELDAARALTKGGRAGRRLRAGPDHRAARRPQARAGLHLRTPATRLPTHPTPPAALPHRRRGTHQPPQTRLRHAPQPPQRR